MTTSLEPDAHVLLVDDEPAVLRGLRRMLESARPSWQVECARDGHEALERLAASPFDVVMLDLQMPRMDGLTLIQRMLQLHPQARRVVHSSHVDSLSGLEPSLAQDLAHEVVPKAASSTHTLAVLDRAVAASTLGNPNPQTACV